MVDYRNYLVVILRLTKHLPPCRNLKVIFYPEVTLSANGESNPSRTEIGG